MPDDILITTEIISDLEHDINDYLMINYDENGFIFENLSLLYTLVYNLKEILEDEELLNIDIDYNSIRKVDFLKKIQIAKDFYKTLNIKFDFESLIIDGTIGCEFFDFGYDLEATEEEKEFCLQNGCTYHENDKKLIDLWNTGLVTDIPVLIHELSHFRNLPDDGRDLISLLFTEALAYFDDFLCIDYLEELGYCNEAVLQRKLSLSYFYLLAENTLPLYKMFNLYENLGSIKKEDYEYFYGDIDEDMNDFDYDLETLIESTWDLSEATFYLFGVYLGAFMYLEYQKDNNFLKNILKLYTKINESDISECFKLIGLNDLSDNDLPKLFDAVEKLKDKALRKSLEKNS